MKNSILVVALVVSFLCSCKKEDKKEEVEIIPKSNEAVIRECFESVKGKDTIQLNINIENQNVTGNLTYKLFEKDKNVGIIQGTMIGDTLFADYKFMSEGVESFRQVAFIKQDGKLSEFYGEVEEKEGKIVFKDKSKLVLNSGFILSSVPCK
ncbi:hypothetical protein [Flavobacterium sp.]|uniref:hypothetical protein n=1 Tax=Flavobacterium sp. TaxID=239 RepID=UPI00260F1B66|nr:hypothetical protein [Flavobacterium sp.]